MKHLPNSNKTPSKTSFGHLKICQFGIGECSEFSFGDRKLALGLYREPLPPNLLLTLSLARVPGSPLQRSGKVWQQLLSSQRGVICSQGRQGWR